MLLFLDTAELSEIQKYAFLLHGVTTTPTIIKRAGLTSNEFITRVRDEFPQLEIHIEALAKDTVATKKLILNDYCQKSWYDAEKIVFKVPVSREGLQAVQELGESNPKVKINLHMVFSAAQATLAMHTKPAYIAPLLGRYADKVAQLNNNGRRSVGDDAGMEMLRSILACKNTIKSNTHILASSIRTVHDFANSIVLGADAVTLPPAILKEALEHPMTDEGVKVFWEDLN